MSKIIVAATGHRPHKLGGYSFETFQKIRVLAQVWLVDIQPTHVISGMALGWDQAVAQAATNLEIPFTAAVPFASQGNNWPEYAVYFYDQLLKRAQEIVVVCNGDYQPWKMQTRNEWMVDRADLILALWDGSPGGTANCIQYARQQKVKVVNTFPEFQLLGGQS